MGGPGQVGAEGGEAGSAAECSTHIDCVEQNFAEPSLCRAGHCQPLAIEPECPLVLGLGEDLENLSAPDPVVLGVYADLDPARLRESRAVLNYELALDEVSRVSFGGLRDASGERHPVLAVVCQGKNPDLTRSLTHLVDDLEVPGIIASLSSPALAQAFADSAQRSEFFLNTNPVDSSLSALGRTASPRRLWHMRAGGATFAPHYQGLVARAEAAIQTRRAMLGRQAPTRVALVVAEHPFLDELADSLEQLLWFNGMGAAANEAAGNYIVQKVESALLVEAPDLDEAAAKLQAFSPDLVIALATGEFIDAILARLEPIQELGDEPPYFILSPYHEHLSDLATLVDARAFIHQRIVGISWATFDGYEAYLSNLKAEYPKASLELAGAGHYYDAAYYMIYSIAAGLAAGAPTGQTLATGMRRLVDGDENFWVGPSDANQVISALATSERSLRLHGVSGAPDFDERGVRDTPARFWCIEIGETSGHAEFVDASLALDTDTGEVTGDSSCLPDF